jgi:hypothetical protein
MLKRGRIRGWSHFWSFGYPAGELYPFGAEAWVAGFYALTFGLLSWTWTYAVAFTGMLAFATYAMFAFARRFFGVTAGFVAAALWLADRGAWYQGGWYWQSWLGVWPVSLGAAFTLLALVKMADVLSPEREARKRWDCAVAALWMAASLLTHLLPMVVYPIALPCLWLNERLRADRLPAGATARLIGAAAMGAGLPAFSLLPMIARSDLTMDLGVPGFSLLDLAHRIVELRTFDGMWPLIQVLALVGGVLAVRRLAPASLFFVVCGAIFVLLSSNMLVEVLHFDRLSKGFLKIECQRMLLVAKLFWFSLAGHAIAVIVKGTPAVPDRVLRSPLRIAGCLVLVAALGAAVVRPVATYIYETQVDKEIEHRGDTPFWHDLEQFFTWSRAERESTGDFYRIAYEIQPHDHISTLGPIFNQTPLYKVGYTSTQIFRSFPMSTEPELLESLSVKYLLSDHEIGDPNLVLERRFGQFWVYRSERYVARHPFTLIGGGQAELVRFDPELIQIKLRGTTPGTRLKLHVNAYPRWEASLNGRHLPIAPATAFGMEYPFLMEVPAADGDLVFRYARRAVDWAGLLITWAALIALGLCAFGRMGSVVRPAWFPVLIRAGRFGRALATGGVLLLVGIGVRRLALPPPLPAGSVFALRSRDSTLTLAGQPCGRRGSAKWRCGDSDVAAKVVRGPYGSHFCMNAPSSGPLTYTVNAKLGRYIEGRYDPDQLTGSIRVFMDNQLLGAATAHPDKEELRAGLVFLQIDTRSRAGQSARLRFELEGGPLRCFDFSIAP